MNLNQFYILIRIYSTELIYIYNIISIMTSLVESSIFSAIHPEWIAYICLLLTLIGISIYVYYYFVEPKLYTDYVSKTEFPLQSKETSTGTTSTGTTSTATQSNAYLYLYSVDWCPHCCKLKDMTFYEKWFEDKMDETEWGDYKLYTIVYNPETDRHEEFGKYETADEEMQDRIKEYKPEGYPTVVLFKPDGKNIELDAKITDDSLTAFLTTKLGKPLGSS